MNKSQLIRLLAETVAGMQVPISMGMPLGTADSSLREVMGVTPIGWATPDEYEAIFTEILK